MSDTCVQEDVEIHVVGYGDDHEAALVCQHCDWTHVISGMRPNEARAHLDAHLNRDTSPVALLVASEELEAILVEEERQTWTVQDNPLIAAYHRMYDFKDEQVRGSSEFVAMYNHLSSLADAMVLLGIPVPKRFDKERS